MRRTRRQTSNLQAAQADVEHGLYTDQCRRCDLAGRARLQQRLLDLSQSTGDPEATAMSSTMRMAAPPACHQSRYLAPYADILSNPAYTTFKSNWAWANLTDNKAVRRQRRRCSGTRPSTLSLPATTHGHRRALRRPRRRSNLRPLSHQRHVGGRVDCVAMRMVRRPITRCAGYGPYGCTTRIRAMAHPTSPTPRPRQQPGAGQQRFRISRVGNIMP